MLDELTAEEICRLVQILQAIPEGTTCAIGAALYMLESAPGVTSLCAKVEEAGGREDVQAYIAAHYS